MNKRSLLSELYWELKQQGLVFVTSSSKSEAIYLGFYVDDDYPLRLALHSPVHESSYQAFNVIIDDGNEYHYLVKSSSVDDVKKLAQDIYKEYEQWYIQRHINYYQREIELSKKAGIDYQDEQEELLHWQSLKESGDKIR